LSVGSLTVGGAGKTPLAARLAHALHRRGHRVVLASRGYGRRSRELVQVVSDGSRVHSDLEASGDESRVLAAHAPGVPVLVGRDRRIVGQHAVSVFGAELLVLDDGFQHHRLARDLDLVCVDGRAGFGNGYGLPRGPLREPLSALRHADWIVLIDPSEGEGADGLDWSRLAPDAPIVRAHRRPVGLVRLGRQGWDPANSLRGRRVGLISGLARPASLRHSVESLGAEVVGELVFPDHHRFRARDLAGLDPTIPEWITTEKDASKILPRWTGAARIRVLAMEIEIDDERAVLDALEVELQRRRRLR